MRNQSLSLDRNTSNEKWFYRILCFVVGVSFLGLFYLFPMTIAEGHTAFKNLQLYIALGGVTELMPSSLVMFFAGVGAFITLTKGYKHPLVYSKELAKDYDETDNERLFSKGEKGIRGAIIHTAPPPSLMAMIQKDCDKTTEVYGHPVPPIRIADAPFPYSFENRGIYLQGSAGSGKSQVIKQMIYDVRRRGGRDKLLVYDRKPEYVTFMYQEGDLIICPADRRHTPWDLFCEAKGVNDLDNVLQSLIPPATSGEKSEAFWTETARSVMRGVLTHLLEGREDQWEKIKKGDKYKPSAPSNNALVRLVFNYGSDPKLLYYRLSGKDPKSGQDNNAFEKSPSVIKDVSSLAEAVSGRSASTVPSSVISTLKTYIASFMLPEVGEKGWFSILDWIKDPSTEGSAVFLVNPAKHAQRYETYFTVIFDLAMKELISIPNDIHRRIWFFADEFGSLCRLGSVERLLAEGRSKGACVVLGTQDMAQVKRIYKDETETILNNCNSKVLGRVTSKEESQYISELIGDLEGEKESGNSSFSLDAKSGVNLSFREDEGGNRFTRKALLPAEISSLKDLNYLCKFGDNPWFIHRMDYYPWNEHEFCPPLLERAVSHFSSNRLIDLSMYGG